MYLAKTDNPQAGYDLVRAILRWGSSPAVGLKIRLQAGVIRLSPDRGPMGRPELKRPACRSIAMFFHVPIQERGKS